MFFGETRISIDEKGRLALPTEHRASISALSAGQLVICYNPYEADSVWIFPRPEWERVREQTMRLKTAKAAHREFQRRLVGAAQVVEMDGNGRILLPHAARTHANLGKTAVLLGLGHKFELWGEAAYLARMQQSISEDQVTADMLELEL